MRLYLAGVFVAAIGGNVIAAGSASSAADASASRQKLSADRVVVNAPRDSAGGFERVRAALEHAMSAAETVEVFEGLPHPMEKEVLAEEKRKPTRQFDGEWFYAQPQLVPRETRAELETLLATPAIAPYRGTKLCGGFHADYAVRWTWNKGGSTTLLLVCFGCQEARVISGGRWTTDLTAEGAQKLRRLFAAFQKERPPPAYKIEAAPAAR